MMRRATRWLAMTIAGHAGSSSAKTRFALLPGNDDTVDNSSNTSTDIRRYRRYINPARHVRAFGVWIGSAEMTGSTRSSDGLDDRRKRLLFRCWHRGTREMDLILGRFADTEIADLTEAELVQLEHLIEVPDPDLYAALIGNAPLAPEYASSLFERIRSFRSADRDA
jgi:antitoxin CptB